VLKPPQKPMSRKVFKEESLTIFKERIHKTPAKTKQALKFAIKVVQGNEDEVF
jgi:hypothetical protein